MTLGMARHRVQAVERPANWRVRVAYDLLKEEMVRLCGVRGELDERIRQKTREIEVLLAYMRKLADEAPDANLRDEMKRYIAEYEAQHARKPAPSSEAI